MGSQSERLDQALNAVAELLGHRLEVRTRRVNSTTSHYWCECSCGYKTEPGKSWRRHVASGIGHVQRVSRDLAPETRANLGESLRDMAAAAVQNGR